MVEFIGWVVICIVVIGVLAQLFKLIDISVEIRRDASKID